MTLVTISLILFLIMNPLGQLKTFAKCLEGIAPKRQQEIISRELFIALGVLLFFDIVGEYVFNLLQISDVTVYLSLGTVLFLAAIKILFPGPDGHAIARPDGEPYLVPIAIPMIAGPSLLATVMLYAQTEPDPFMTLAGIIIAWFAGAIVLLNHKRLFSILKSSGILALEKLMGMILLLIAVQRFLEGVIMLYKSLT